MASVHRRVWRKVVAEPKTIGEHLRKKRVDMGLTNVQVARLLGVCYQTVERWEHGRCPMKSKHRAKVVAFLGYDPDTGKPKPSTWRACWEFVSWFSM
jgi:transcriptional regulator with XRE-family HTH domain